MSAVPPLVLDPSATPAAFRRLVEELGVAGLDEATLQRVATASSWPIAFDGPVGFDAQRPGSDACAGRPVATLLRLFQECRAVPNAELEAILTTESIGLLERCRLIERNAGETSSRLKLSAWRGLVIVSDHERYERDCVFEPNRSTARVEATFPLLARGARAVDIGVGSGALSMLLRRRVLALSLLAVDVEERALDFTRFNCALNGLAPPELRLSDHHALDTLTGLDYVAWNMPATYGSAEQVGLAFEHEGEGLQTLRQLYGALSRCLAPRGLAGLRHDMRSSRLSPDGIAEELGVTDGLQILFMHLVPTDEEAKHVVEGAALVRPAKGATRVSLLPVRCDERRHFSAERMWQSVLAVPGWEDTLAVVGST